MLIKGDREQNVPKNNYIKSTPPLSTPTRPITGQDVIPEFPDLISSLFLPMIEDMQLLKTCRLVCTSWNHSVCEVLRSRSYVLVKEKGSHLKQLRGLLFNRIVGPFKYLPSPFKNFHVIASSFVETYFNDIVMLPNVIVTNVVLRFGNGSLLNPKALETFLNAKKTSITDLSIYSDSDCLTNLNTRNKIRLKRLKRLFFMDTCKSIHRGDTQFIKELIRESRLEEIGIHSDNPRMLTMLLSDNFLDDLKELDLSCAAISTEAWDFLGNQMSLRKLKKLRVMIWNCTQEFYAEPLALLIERVSPFIEDLELNIKVELNNNFFPNLRRICMWENGLSPFTVDRFPLLQEIDLKIPKTFWTHLETDFDPHGGVEFVRVFVQGTVSTEENALDIQMPLLLSCLSRKFPNVKNFNLSCLQHYSRFCTNIFRDICHFFPHLKKLRFNGSVDFPMISGTHMNVVHDCLEAGWPIQSIPRRSGSIVDLKELETLHFGSDAHITDDMIKYCLSLMPNLNVLEFHSNPHVSTQVVEDYLGHLKTIQIY